MAAPRESERPRATMPRSRRLAHDLEYEAVYEAKMRKSAGPLTVFSMPNGRTFYRLGLAVGKRVGRATVRVREKRMIREAFRLLQHELPRREDQTCYDLVISSRAHGPLELDGYLAALQDAVAQAHQAWTRRSRRAKPSDASPAGDAP
jgi:ribonuclease P protein component